MGLFSRKWLLAAGAGVLMASVAITPAKAEVSTVNLAQQFGLLYVPLHVVLEHNLVQKHAKKIGLTPPEIKLFKISGGANINKALLAKTIDFGAHGIGPALKLWGKTKGAFKIASGMADMPLKLLTNDPRVKSVDDYLTITDHKIATPAAKVSVQAVTLQMYTEMKYGDAEKLDHLVVSMKHPIALAAILSGGQTVKSHFATLPYSFQELKSGKVHKVIDSYEILGGPATVLVMSCSQAFKDANPKTYEAVINAYNEAFEWVNANPVKAAELYIKYTKTKLDPNDVKAMLTNKDEIAFDPTPKQTMKYAKFLAKIGDIPMPSSWKDFYYSNNHNMSGS